MSKKANHRIIYPADDDPGALRIETSLQGVSARGVALIAIDDPKFGDDCERQVRDELGG